MVKNPGKYKWSSHQVYLGKMTLPWLETDFILSTFSPGDRKRLRQRRYREFVENLMGKDYESPLTHTVASTILGGADFVETIMADHLEKEAEHPDVPALRALNRRYAVENIIAKTQELVDEPKLAKEVSLHICHRYSGERLKNIGAHFNG